MDKNINKQKAQSAIAPHAGRVVRGRWVDKNSPVAQTLKKCDECALRGSCGSYLKKARCHYQIQNLKAEYKMQGALTSGDPMDLLRNIQSTIARLESVINYDEMVGEKPNKNDIKELCFLKLQVYEMVYGRSKPTTAVQVNAPQINIKDLMSELRKEPADAGDMQ